MLKRLTYLLLFFLLLVKGVSTAFPSALSFSHKATSAFNNNQGFYNNPDVKNLDAADLFFEEEREEEEESENAKRSFAADLANWILTAGLHSFSNNIVLYPQGHAQGFTQTANHIFIRVIRV